MSNNQGELMAQVKGWIKESAETTATLVKAEMKSELLQTRIEMKEEYRQVVQEELSKEMAKYFGQMPPHRHAQHHQDLENFQQTRSSIVSAIVKRAAIGLIIAGLFYNSNFVVMFKDEQSEPKAAQTVELVE
jgi:hypothetical protein